MVCGAVGALRRSCVVWRRGAVGIRRGVFSRICRYVGWSHSSFDSYVFKFSRIDFVKFKFQVGLVFGVR